MEDLIEKIAKEELQRFIAKNGRFPTDEEQRELAKFVIAKAIATQIAFSLVHKNEDCKRKEF